MNKLFCFCRTELSSGVFVFFVGLLALQVSPARAASIRISEFMADNDGVVVDEDGDFSDWIELYNATGLPVDLAGWYLTDDADDLTKWRFPLSQQVEAGGCVLVFASGKDRAEAGKELHTNFKLDAKGEYLALVRPDGESVADDFSPAFPPQHEDISFGTGLDVTTSVLVENDTASKLIVPDDASELPNDWFAAAGGGAGWAPASASIGYETSGSATNVPLAAYWKLDEGEGTTAGETILGNDGTLENFAPGSEWTPDTPIVPTANAFAVEFDGANDYIDTPFHGIGGAESRTVCFWLKTSEKSECGIVAWGDHRASGEKWHVRINSSSSNGRVGAIRTEAQGGYKIGDTMVADGNWHHIASVFEKDDSPDIRDVVIYVDGQVDGTSGHNGQTINTDISSSDALPVNIGRRGSGNEFNYLEGAVSDVAVFAGALDTDAIQALAEGTAKPTDLTSYRDVFITDVRQEMFDVNASAFLRIPFSVDTGRASGSLFDRLMLRMKYDDGFVAYLNGSMIAMRNAPTELNWNACSTVERFDRDAIVYESFNITEHLGLLGEENVLAVHGLNSALDDEDFLIAPEVTGSIVAETPERYFSSPTPGGLNGPGFAGFVSPPAFSVGRGFYEEGFEVALSTDTPGALIRYTTDGSWPSPTSGILYTTKMPVETTTILRAVAYKDGYKPSAVVTHTYVFLHDVIRQPKRPPGFPMDWTNRSADYEMDPEIVDDQRYRDDILDAMRTHPTISIVMDIDDLFDPDTGIYSNSQEHGREWERPTSVELFDFPEGAEVQVNAGIRMVGKASRSPNRPKHNMRLVFRGEYGPKRLEFPLFENCDVERFNSIILRGGNGDSWVNPGVIHRAQYIRDQWHRDMQVAMGQPTAAQGYVHLYINGLYWGLYHTIERVEDDLFAEHFGGEEEDYDVVKDLAHSRTGVEAVDGNKDAWFTLVDLTRGGVYTDEQYDAVKQYLDVDNLIDYMLVNFYSGNNDWDSNNWRAARRREPGAGFIFFCWDSERTDLNGLNSGGTVDVDVTGTNRTNQPTSIHQALTHNSEYRLCFADHIQRHFFNNGVLTPRGVAESWDRRADEIRLALVAESARWGDAHISTPRTPDTWQQHLNQLKWNFFPVRTGIVFDQLKERGLYPQTAAATFSKHGGHVPEGYELVITAPAGVICCSFDGTDPRKAGDRINEMIYQGPITINKSVVVKARVIEGTFWSPMTEAEFRVDVPAEVSGLLVTELNYHPHGPYPAEVDAGFDDDDDFEFIEIRNVGEASVDLSDVRITDGVSFDFAASACISLSPGENVVVVKNAAAFEMRYDTTGLNVAGEYDKTLDNGGEGIEVQDGAGGVLRFAYDDSGEWPDRADGKGSSLVLIDPSSVPEDPAERTGYLGDGDNWRSSEMYGGTPGGGNPTTPLGIVLNEVLSLPRDGQAKAVELVNTTGMIVDIAGWYLTDTADNMTKLQLTPQEGNSYMIVPPGGYVLLDANDLAGGAGSGGIELDPIGGGDLWLIAGDGSRPLRFADHIEYGPALEGVATGRWPEGSGELYPMSEFTPGSANSGPRAGDLVISEIMYHPPDPQLPSIQAQDLEFIEVVNRTNRAVALEEWHLAGGVWLSPLGEGVLDPGETIVLLPFDLNDPVDSARRTAFEQIYGLAAPLSTATTGDGYHGPFSGKLDNGGEDVRLLRACPSPEGYPPGVRLVVEDQVVYDDELPWPTEADGSGKSLARVGSELWAGDPANWTADAPSPGLVGSVPGDVTGDNCCNVADLLTVRNNLGKTDDEVSPAAADVNGDDAVNVADLLFVRNRLGEGDGCP